jgi:hypothetical protein
VLEKGYLSKTELDDILSPENMTGPRHMRRDRRETPMSKIEEREDRALYLSGAWLWITLPAEGLPGGETGPCHRWSQ